MVVDTDDYSIVIFWFNILGLVDNSPLIAMSFDLAASVVNCQFISSGFAIETAFFHDCLLVGFVFPVPFLKEGMVHFGFPQVDLASAAASLRGGTLKSVLRGLLARESQFLDIILALALFALPREVERV